MAGVMRCDNLAAVQALLNCGADLNAASSDGYTALHYAAAHAEFGMVRVLVEAGADLDRRNGESLTPLELAKDRSRIQTGMDYSRVIAYLTKQSEKRPPVRHAPNADYQRMDVPKSTREAPRQKNSRAQRGN
jgi:ankyrin repeat protein